MYEKQNKYSLNTTFYKKFDFWIGLFIILTSRDVFNIQIKTFGWWLDVSVLVIGIIAVISAFITKNSN